LETTTEDIKKSVVAKEDTSLEELFGRLGRTEEGIVLIEEMREKLTKILERDLKP
jgi:hypothetical protein